MKNLYVENTLAVLAKTKGFNLPCCKYLYHGNTSNNVDRIIEVLPSLARNYNEEDIMCTSIPMYFQVQQWLRDEKQLHLYIVPQGDCKSWHICNIGRTDTRNNFDRIFPEIREKYEHIKFNSYEAALAIAIEEALNLI